jgi:transposase-like protein
MIRPINKSSVRVRRKFDQTFKREAVRNWLASGKSAEIIGKELGLHADRLYAWRRDFAPEDAGGRAAAGAKSGSVADLQNQLEAALRENRHLREQRDILKKTLGILSEPPSNAMRGLKP